MYIYIYIIVNRYRLCFRNRLRFRNRNRLRYRNRLEIRRAADLRQLCKRNCIRGSSPASHRKADENVEYVGTNRTINDAKQYMDIYIYIYEYIYKQT